MEEIDIMRERFELAPSVPSGIIYKINSRRARVGDMGGGLDAKGYYKVKINGKMYKSHHIVCMLANINGWKELREQCLAVDGNHGGLVVNHIDENPANNNSSNLEIIQNSRNLMLSRLSRGLIPTSIHQGVSLCNSSGKWVSRISINGKIKWLGSFNLELDAAKAYITALEEKEIKRGV